MNISPNPDTENTPEKSMAPIDLIGLCLDYVANWKWFVVSIILCVAVSYVLCRRIIPVYSVSASIYLAEAENARQQRSIVRADKASISEVANVDETEIQRLMSRGMVEPVVRELGMAYRYYRSGFWRDIPLYRNNPVVAEMDSADLYSIAEWQSVNVFIKKDKDNRYKVRTSTEYGSEKHEQETLTPLPAVIATPHGNVRLRLSETSAMDNDGYRISILNPRDVATQLSVYTFNVGYARNSQSILRMLMHTEIPAQGEDFMRALVRLYNDEIILEKNRSAMQTEEFIMDRLMMLNGELRDVESRLEEYKRSHGVPVTVEQQAAIYSQKTNSAEEMLMELDLQADMLLQLEAAITRQNSYAAIPGITSDPSVNAELQEYNRKIANLERAKGSASDDNPLVRKMKEDIDRDKDKLLSVVRSVRAGVNSKRSSVRSKGNENAGRLTSVPTVDKGIQEIFREQQVKVNIYTYLLQKREEIALQKTLATPTAQFINAPDCSGIVRPFRRMYLMTGAVIGLLLPALIILLRRLIFPSFKDKEELLRATSLPIIGELSHIENKSSDIVAVHGEDNQINELFRLIRSNIEFTNPDRDKKVILVTSTIPGEGKSFFAANLALTFALAGKKVLLVGSDIRRPRIHKIFNFKNNQGLTNLLSGTVSDLDSLLWTDSAYPDLWVLPSGPVAPNPNELLLSERMKKFLLKAREEYDYVILDSAPVGLVSDTLIIAPLSDIQIVVVRAGVTRRKSLDIIESEVRTGRLTACYYVINDVAMQSGSYAYRRYGKYSQGSNYGYR